MNWCALVAAGVVAVATLAGCSSGNSDSSGDGDLGGLCDVIDAETLSRFSGAHNARESLMLGSEEFLSCDADGMSSFEFGVRLDDGTDLASYLSGEVEPLDDIGDEAYWVASYGDPEQGEWIVARSGEVVALVRNDLLWHDDERSTKQDTRDVVNALLELSPDEVAALPAVDVSGSCPSADEAAVVIGDVMQARGADIAGETNCAYVSADNVRLLISQINADNAADFIHGQESLLAK